MLLALLSLVFASIFISFNLFTYKYIRSHVEEQLDDLTANFGIGEYRPGEPRLPDLSLQRPNRIGARGEVFVISGDYELQVVGGVGMGGNASELALIAKDLEQRLVDLRCARYVRVTTTNGEYYLSSVEDPYRPGSFFIFYVSVSGINNLASAINLAMAVIVAVAMLVCFIITNLIASSITKPIKKLSEFADEIGKGNFARKAFDFNDIEFEELGEAMNQSAEKLDLYDKDQRTFFQNVSHEFRTPLQSIRCYAEGVECGLMDAKKSSQTIMNETDRLSELVEDLLYISRVDTISNQIEKNGNDLRDTFALCAEEQKLLANKNGIYFQYQFDDNPVIFTYNEKHMYRAISNLISNAVRHASSTVTLHCHASDDKISLSVLDDGIGIAPDDLPHIFERFYKGRGGKHGIGLSIVKSVVELHGGKISVTCDGGTCFTMTFENKTPRV